ncbi:hypothetical protein EXIGLDRAFT_763442 [Exidia glandulosa HHB12029]|uniref:Uncharacterized protein n=1 Tax=Exidia glandulosa HHB12029 TaxID=1314781 RepID=A0A166B7J8_EXIGL|nr:hypothetical protein EXIGLDRAFT_763442 [Exidia glandulosa HHB12029]
MPPPSSMPPSGPRFLMEPGGMQSPIPRQREEYVEFHRFLGEVLQGDGVPTLDQWNTAWAELCNVYDMRDQYERRYLLERTKNEVRERRFQRVLTSAYRLYLRVRDLEQHMAREEVERADRTLQADIDALLEEMSAEERRRADETKAIERELQDELLAMEAYAPCFFPQRAHTHTTPRAAHPSSLRSAFPAGCSSWSRRSLRV